MSGRVLIIGGGLAGLSTAWHLGDEAVLLEGASEVGGLCRSYRKKGYIFDVSGHLLHFRRPVIRRFVGSLLPRQLSRSERKASISFRGRHVDYPFQANLHQLPPKIRQECYEGFLDATDRKNWSGTIPPADFSAWIRHHFGPGIARHFIEPYNRKMWQVPLRELTAEWAEWAVPVPTVEQVQAAAEGRGKTAFGYNPVFYYPREGGIGTLARVLAGEVARLHLGEKAVEVDLARRRVLTAGGRTFHFERLVSTAPLPELLRMTKGIPPDLAEAGESLRYVSVCVFNVGLSRPGPVDLHWIYYPGRGFPFYRVGFAHNIHPTGTPPGSSSFYVEVSRRPDAPESCSELWGEVREGLVKAGLMESGEEPEVLDIINIPYAYVLYDRNRERLLPFILGKLEEKGISSIGRYGAWEYSTMEDALAQGRATAGRLGGRP